MTEYQHLNNNRFQLKKKQKERMSMVPPKSHKQIIQNSPTSIISSCNQYPANTLLQLKSKKKQTIGQQQKIQQKIKQHFSDITIKLQDKEQQILKNLENQMYTFYQSIDHYCSMSQYERNLVDNRCKIDRILQWKLDIVPNRKLMDIIDKGHIIDICFQESDSSVDIRDINDSNIGYQTDKQRQKTSKKGNQKTYHVLKMAQMDEINSLQQKIQKLMLKQDKLKLRISEMQSKLKMKKIGNTYLPVLSSSSINMNPGSNTLINNSALAGQGQKNPIISNLLLKRLQSQNKILVEQLADCSQKLICLRSQNSLLVKEREKQKDNNSQILPTEKKRINQSIQVVEQSIQRTQQYSQISVIVQQKIANYQAQMQRLKNELSSQKQNYQNQIQIYKQNLHILQHYQIKIQQLSDYRVRIEQQCQSNIQKKVQLQQKLEILQNKYQQLEDKYKLMNKELESSKEMKNNYFKLIKLKDDKVIEYDIQNKKYQIKLQEAESANKKNYIQLTQKIAEKQQIIKLKTMQIQSLKSLLKKQQQQKSATTEKISKKQQEQYLLQQKVKALQTQITKANKQKQSYCKKQVNKLKKQMKKIQQEEMEKQREEFKCKYGDMLEKLDSIKKEYIDNKDKYERKIKLYDNQRQIFKEKTAFQMKQMLEKVIKMSNQKDKQKLLSIIQSYIQNQSSLTLKNTQIKMLKQQITSLKKGPAKKLQGLKTNVTPLSCTQAEVTNEMQQFSIKLYNQKLQLQQSIHQSRMKQQTQMHQLQMQQKISTIESLTQKNYLNEKIIRQLKSQLSSVNSATNPQISQLKKTNTQMAQKQQRIQSQLNSVKNNLSKTQSQLQQTKQQLKLKKDIIAGLKKELKDRELQKNKLNQTLNLLIQQSQKMKRTKQQANKKQAIFTQFKDKLINQTELSEQICQLRTTLDQKSKQYKLQLNKKQQTIKQLKISEEQLNKKMKAMNSLQDQIVDLKQKLKKNKLQVQRKDALIQHLKQKHEKNTNQYQNNVQASQTELKKAKKQYDMQRSKSQALKNKLSKLQTNYQLVKLAFIKVYEQIYHKINVSKSFTSFNQNINPNVNINEYLSANSSKDYKTLKSDSKRNRYDFTTTQKTQKQRSPQPIDMKKYKQALSILQISSEQFELASNPGINTNISINNPKYAETVMYSPIPNKIMNQSTAHAQDSVKLAKLLQSDDIDSKAIVEIFSFILQV